MALLNCVFVAIIVHIAESHVVRLEPRTAVPPRPPLTPRPTISPVCPMDGKIYPHGGYQLNPCQSCYCDSRGVHSCLIFDCFLTPCVNSVYHKGQCCPTCPDGPNCLIGNQTVPVGKTVQIRQNNTISECVCHSGGYAPPTCHAVFTPPKGCTYQGKFYQFGPFKPTPCEHCQCEASGRAICAIEDCFFTLCVDAVHRNDTCCPVCPNGHNCYAGNKIIPAGNKVQINNQTSCHCPSPSDSNIQLGMNNAICVFDNTLTPATSLPVVG